MDNRKGKDTDKIAPHKIDYNKPGVPESYAAAFNGDLDAIQNKHNPHDKGKGKQHHFKGRSLLHAAAEGGNPKIIEFLVKRGEEVNILDGQGYASLHIAAWYGNLEAVNSLIKMHADVDIKCVYNSMRPIHFAVCGDHEEVVNALLDAGVEINAVDSQGKTALHYACAVVNSDILRILIRNKASMDISDKFGKTAPDIVYDNDEFELLTIMTNNGADIAKLYDEQWNQKLREAKQEEVDDSTLDFYGFYPRDHDLTANHPQRDIKQKHIKKWKKIFNLTPDQIPKKGESASPSEYTKIDSPIISAVIFGNSVYK